MLPLLIASLVALIAACEMSVFGCIEEDCAIAERLLEMDIIRTLAVIVKIFLIIFFYFEKSKQVGILNNII